MVNANDNFETLLIGIWAPVSGNPADTMEYRADGSVRMAMFGGAYHMGGYYRFIEPDVVELAWGDSVSPEAENVVGELNNRLQEKGVGASLGVVRKSALRVAVSEDQLVTVHLDKGRIGHFRRIVADGNE
jgi:hypothetical protein